MNFFACALYALFGAAVAATYPKDVAYDESGDATGYARSTRDRLLQELQAMQLITKPRRGYVRAADNLFDRKEK